MIKIAFSEVDKKALDYERYHHPHPRVQRKMEALWLKSQGLPHKDICRLTRISKGTLCAYLRTYQQGGIEKLKELNFYRPSSELVEHASTLEEYFRQHPPASLKEAMAKIEQLTGIKRSEVQVRHFLKSLGMKPRKVGMIPAKPDVDEQETFKEEELEPRLDGEEELPGKTNYLVGENPEKWLTNIPHSARVRYEAVYPGIDLAYYGNQHQLE